MSFHFPANIGTVNATSCVNRVVTGLPALGDLLLLTPNVDDAHGALIYDARYDIDADRVTIHMCNFSNAASNPRRRPRPRVSRRSDPGEVVAGLAIIGSS
jgi:hypothetical protein